MDFYECWCTSESTNIFISNGHLFWVQKYQSQPFETSPSKGFGSHVASRPFYFAIKAHKKSYPHKWPSDQSSNFRVFFSVGIFTLRFSLCKWFLLPPWSSKFNAFQLGCHLHKNPTSYITSSSFEAAAHFVCIFQPGNFTPGGTTRNPKSYLLWHFETPKGGFYQKQRHLQYVGHRCERWP